MRTKQTVFIFLLLLCGLGRLQAQQQITVATGTAGTPDHHPGPIYRSSATSTYDFSRYAYLYTASELSTEGFKPGMTITEIAWYKSNTATLGTTRVNSFKVYLKNSNETSYSQATVSWTDLIANTSLAFDSIITTTNTAGWVMVRLQTPFVYSGGSLEVITDFDNDQGTGNASSADFDWAWRTVNARIYGYATTSAPATLSSTSNSIGTITNKRPDIQFTVLPQKMNDIGATSFVSPLMGTCPGTYDIKVRVSNLGANQVDTFQLNWRLNGNLQTPLNVYQLIDTFGATNGNTLDITLGNQAFSAGQTYAFEAWTSSPNNLSDSVPSNDSTAHTFSPALSGTYTVGGSSPDYTSIGAAIADLAAYGICGPVLIDIRSGTYNEAIDIPVIAGSSSTNTITIQGAGAATTHIVGRGSTNFATIGILGTDYLTIKNLTIENDQNIADSWAVYLTGQADYVTIEACSILVPISTTTDIAGVMISGSATSDATEGNNANYFTLRSCYVSGGEKNVVFEGGGNAAPNIGNRVIDCELTQSDDYGFYSDDQDGLQLIGNHIHSLINATLADGIYTVGGYNYTIEANRIDVVDYGIYLFDLNVNGLSFKASRVVNNMVRSSGDYGIYLNDVDSVFLYHNTVVGEPALYVNDQTNLDIRNNIFVSTTDQAVDFVDATPVGNMNYNLYYNGGVADLFEHSTSTYSNLAAWQTAQSTDANSVEGDPIFVSSSDLHIQGLIANDIGDISVGVTEDIDGDPRPFSPATDVDLGADEIKILNNDAGVVAIQPACVGGNLQVNVRNFGALTLKSFTVNWSLNGTLQTPVSFSGTGLGNFVDSVVSLGAHNMSAGQAYDLKIWTSLPNGVNDPEKTNDSLVLTDIRTGMSGTYTVGTSGDFATANEAIAALAKRGMCGDVELSFLSGTYTEQLAIRGIRKADAAFSLTLTSQSANAQDVLLTYPSATTGDNFTLLIEETDKVVVKNLSIQRSGTSTLSTAIQIEGSDDVTIQDNIILADSGSSSSNTTGSRSAIYSSDVSPENNLLITSNTISGNLNGIWIAGNAVTLSGGLEISENKVAVGYTAMFIEYQEAPLVSENYITRSVVSATSTFYGISLNQVTGAFVIEKNEVIGLMSIGYGIRLRETKSALSNKGLVVNNMVQYNGSSTAYLYTLESNSENIRFVHNTGLVKGGTSTAGRGFYAISAGGENELMNNIFINRGAGYAIYVSNTANASFVKADYNMLYAAGTNLAYWTANRSNLAALQSASGMFAKSGIVDPSFVSNEDLRITDFSEVLVGSPEGITEDVDDNTRCSIPYVGAHEIAPSSAPITVDFSVPDTLYAGGRGLFINSALRRERRTHSWYVDGVKVSEEVNLFHTFPSTGTYTVKLVSVGCFNSDSMSKTVNVIAPFAIPVVDFTADRTKIFAGDFVTMIDLSSQAPTGWLWSVSPSIGVSIGTEFTQDPVIFFSEPGLYEVCLIADNSFGNGVQVCKTDLIEVFPVSTICVDNGSTAPVGKLFDDGGQFGAYASNKNCSFLIDPCASSVNAQITFWEMGDIDDELRIYNGSVEDPNTLIATFNYASVTPGGTTGITASSGTMLVVWKTDASTVAEGFALEWTSTPLNIQQSAGFTLPDTAFVDAPVFINSFASGAKLTTTWDMDFPNGVAISKTGDQLFHTYTAAGTYTVRQLVNGCAGIDTTDKTIVVIQPTLAPSPVDFVANRLTLTTNDVLQLSDLSGNGPSSWKWEITPSAGVSFVGNTNSPVVEVEFANTGTYDVKLVVNNAIGADSLVKTAYIRVIEYCLPNAGMLSGEIGINHVNFAGIDQFSTIGENAYSDFTQSGQEATVSLGETYAISISRNASSQAMTRKVWIDWNQDGDFRDLGELVALENATTTPSFNTFINVPVDALPGLTRMRVAAGYNSDPASSCGPALIGEFEDYSVMVLGDITKPVITLLGTTPVSVEAGYGYTDAGSTAFDQVDGFITQAIQVIGNVDTTVVGTYVLKYVVEDFAGNVSDTVIRIVHVTSDVTAPILVLNGANQVSMEVYNSFVEPGFSAVDNPWGLNLTDSVKITSTLDTAKLGTYSITYSVTDLSGNTTTLSRTIVVFDSTSPVLTLNVAGPYIVEVNTPFVAPGTSVSDNYWTVSSVQVTGTVDMTTLGTYQLSYTATDGSGNVSQPVTLEVIVRDQTAPVITLAGNDVVNLSRWQTYTDMGYLLSDNYNDSVDITVVTEGDWVNSAEEGLYYLQYKATDASGNVAYSAKRFIDVRGLNSAPVIESNELTLYPNPSSGTFTVSSESLFAAGTQLVVMDMLGKVVHQQNVQSATDQVLVQTENLKPGMYMVQVINGQERSSLKVQITN